MPPIQGKFRIVSNRRVGPDYFKMAVWAPEVARRAKPGQFVHLRCQDNLEPLLRRPFSFHRLEQNRFEILFKVVGRGTKVLAKKRKGDTIDLLGPLGNGFNLQRTTNKSGAERSLPEGDEQRTTIIVAGGMGAAPLLALAERLAHSAERIADRKRIIVLLGAKDKRQLLCVRDFRKLGCKVQLATDDGTKGRKGPVTDLLKKVLKLSTACARKGINCQLSTIYACGPQPMLKELARIGLRARITVQASLEENMACGIGACLGCAVRTKAGYKRVCKDGPVFNLLEIKW